MKLLQNIKVNFNKINLKTQKYSPEILIVTGVAGVIASTILACKATTKINDVLEKSKEEINIIHESVKKEEYKDVYTVEDSKKDLTIVYAQTGLKIIKLYAPSIILGTLSLTAIITSNNILRRRNVALAAAYSIIDKSYKEYRERVIEKYGKEVDQELKYGVKVEKIEEEVIDEKGKKKKEIKEIKVVDPFKPSDFARFFDEASRYWEKNAEYNLMFLKQQQNWATDRLKAKGHLFLNEVYEALGLPDTKAGQIVGWIYNTDDPNWKGDNCVDFHIYDDYYVRNESEAERKRAFVNGYERSILLDFNVDGNILDLI